MKINFRFTFLIIGLLLSTVFLTNVDAATNSLDSQKSVIKHKKGEIKMAEENKDSNKVTFKSTDVFSDSVLSRHFGHGEYQLDRKDALRLQKSGKGIILKNNRKPDEKASSEVENDDSDENIIVDEDSMNPGDADMTKSVNPTDGDDDSEETELLENFPHRDELIKVGLDTMEKLKSQSGDNLSKDFKFSKAKVTKIGLALAELADGDKSK